MTKARRLISQRGTYLYAHGYTDIRHQIMCYYGPIGRKPWPRADSRNNANISYDNIVRK